jgi:hypothetical protein
MSGAQIGGQAGRCRARATTAIWSMDSRLWHPAWVCLVMNLAKEGAWLRMLPRLINLPGECPQAYLQTIHTPWCASIKLVLNQGCLMLYSFSYFLMFHFLSSATRAPKSQSLFLETHLSVTYIFFSHLSFPAPDVSTTVPFALTCQIRSLLYPTPFWHRQHHLLHCQSPREGLPTVIDLLVGADNWEGSSRLGDLMRRVVFWRGVLTVMVVGRGRELALEVGASGEHT